MTHYLLRYRFRLLFASSVLLVVILGWPQPSRLLEWSGLLLFVLAGVNTLRHKQVFMVLAAVIGLINLLLFALPSVVPLPPPLRDGLGLIAFYVLMTFALFRRVTHERPVTGELLYGLCALYLQLALAFAFTFHMVELLWPGSFQISQGELKLDVFVYYSLVTLTTVGYGDIHALTPPARLLAAAEAVIGVLFIALAVARSLTLIAELDEPVS